LENFKTSTVKELQFDSLVPISETAFKSELAKYENFLPQNSILKDLEYVAKIYEEKITQDKLIHEHYVMKQLEKSCLSIRFNILSI